MGNHIIMEHFFYPCWIFYAAPPSNQDTAIGTCLHTLKRISPGTEKTPNEVVLQKQKRKISVQPKRRKNGKDAKQKNLGHTEGYLSTGISTLIVFLTIKPAKLPCDPSQPCAANCCKSPNLCCYKTDHIM